MTLILAQGLNLISRFGATGGCSKTGPLGLPTWYKYLNVSEDVTGKCSINLYSSSGRLDLNQIWLIGLGVVDILLRIAALVAIGFIIYGGFQYMISQGEPDRTAAARNTILNAVIGLVIAILATVVVGFVGRQFGA